MTDDPVDGSLTVTVVIPAYFEEKTIGSIVERCLPFADEVLVVNDGSTDDTVKAALAAGARVVDLPENVGMLGATQAGLREASGDIIVTLDADGQHDPAHILEVIKPILEGKVDMVMGVRPNFPYFSERVLTWLTSLRVPVGDASTGFRAVTRDIAGKMELHCRCMCGTFVLEGARHGVRVASIPISVRERGDGDRRVQTEHIAQFFIVLRTLFW